MTNEEMRLEIAKVVEQTYAVGRLDEGIGLDAVAHPVLRRITSVDNLMAVFSTALDEAREEAVRDFVDWFASKNLMIIEGEWVENGDILDEYLASKKEQKHDE